ncbi:sugar-binding transcriptional regulator [Paenibacillus apiarius]|uniref:Sugar-binding domain-containing protein n=1 Tax=Paenibacillus apiarius TaxID=46240 RepID=A0ABT4DVJ2_9BACL|nr:sugar-binding domain-containing protein [Paenibacillus apiarius]MCY9516360.1 sugar-binding domain-containing protein [Paenibacillus apiarius]MCY9519991.1 sugar-binding domain-containing protein [Paenibacillus apiarius]MCY9554386.1 sugar-binding domain-containing protein [Paenibacillus apiarius]MCY9558177.1 sugar-binding domain-containing protein [Paenibacillus apiarius]MCY9684972.1 sugar-binding domain-containing protein [Paenibacillus apiarius]
MRDWLEIQKRLLPELIELLKKRYTILHQIMLSESIGRRTLATSLQMTERVLRAETDLLKAQGLIETDSTGMRISEEGRQLVKQLEPFMGELLGMRQLEESIRQAFGLKQVIVVPGNSDVSPAVKQELGQAACKALNSAMGKEDVVAVTGGSTLAAMADQLTSSSPLKGIWFVPARGGLGESLEHQANTIASTMAKRLGAQYRLLHVPDLLSEEAYQSLKQEPNIQDILQVIRQARIVVHGIGDALVMAKRRSVDDATVQQLVEAGALAEAFGYYFDRDGRVVHTMLTLGLRLEDISRTEVVIAVAGGKSKGEAITAVLRSGHEDILVIDEAAAEEVVNQCGLDVPSGRLEL